MRGHKYFVMHNADGAVLGYGVCPDSTYDAQPLRDGYSKTEIMEHHYHDLRKPGGHARFKVSGGRLMSKEGSD